jgi:hypothetical protein
MAKLPKFYPQKNFTFFFHFLKKNHQVAKFHHKKNIVGGRDVGFGRKRNQAKANATTIVQLIKSKDTICIYFHFIILCLG